MPPDAMAQTWNALASVATMAMVIVTVWLALRGQSASQHTDIVQKIESLRAEGDEGRNKLYMKIDSVVHELRSEFVSKEVHAITSKRLDSLDARIINACSQVRSRRASDAGMEPGI